MFHDAGEAEARHDSPSLCEQGSLASRRAPERTPAVSVPEIVRQHCGGSSFLRPVPTPNIEEVGVFPIGTVVWVSPTGTAWL